jgi:hypothetical protein
VVDDAMTDDPMTNDAMTNDAMTNDVMTDELAVAGRMSMLAGRGRAEDFVAINAVLRAGHYTRDRLNELLAERDGGYDPFAFAGVLAELPHIPDEDFTAHGLDDLETAIMRARFADWYRTLVSSGIP